MQPGGLSRSRHVCGGAAAGYLRPYPAAGWGSGTGAAAGCPGMRRRPVPAAAAGCSARASAPPSLGRSGLTRARPRRRQPRAAARLSDTGGCCCDAAAGHGDGGVHMYQRVAAVGGAAADPGPFCGSCDADS